MTVTIYSPQFKFICKINILNINTKYSKIIKNNIYIKNINQIPKKNN